MWNDILIIGLENIQKEKHGLFIIDNIMLNPFGYIIVTLSNGAPNNEKWCIDSKGNATKKRS